MKVEDDFGTEDAAPEKSGEDAEIARVAALPDVAYDRERQPVARKLGIRTPTLDKLVDARRAAEARAAAASAAAEEERRAAEARAAEEAQAAAEPPPPAIDGAQLLDDLAAFVRRFVILTEHQLAAVALWIIHTHAFAAAESTLYLLALSAEKRSGKSRLLEVLELFVARACLAIHVSAAALIRIVSDERATLLLDESDATFARESTYRSAALYP